MECCWREQTTCSLGVTQEVEMIKVRDMITALQKMDPDKGLEVINSDGGLASIKDVEDAISGTKNPEQEFGPGVQVNIG